MKNNSSTLIYILTFLGLGIVSFGITFGALTYLSENDTNESSEMVVSDRDRNETQEDEDIEDEIGTTTTLAVSSGFSIEADIPLGWGVEMFRPSPEQDPLNNRPSYDIRSPEITDENGIGTGIHFCLSFGYGTTLNDQDRAVLSTPANYTESITTLGIDSNLNILATEENPAAPLLTVTSSQQTLEDGSQSYTPIADNRFIAISGAYGCRDNQEAASTYSIEDFALSPEVSTAKDIIRSSNIVITSQEEFDRENADVTEGANTQELVISNNVLLHYDPANPYND